MAPHALATLPPPPPPCGSHKTRETNMCLFPRVIVIWSCHLRRSHKGVHKEKLSEGQSVWVHTNNGTNPLQPLPEHSDLFVRHPSHFSHTKNEQKRPNPLRNFHRHPGEEGCRAHQDRIRMHDPTICKENHTAHVASCHGSPEGAPLLPRDEPRTLLAMETSCH